ncbi:hypothetical protein N802_16370 [Knoellia sinensis KCTC 19936]|uniref:Uncharacterized protein n=1 Tax=Knoellia sinensis KCTC 19936 TaxID=1385520 RepID=A0A0A0JA94_9MICO|nr:hypothetical protein [Knoellia sinensis]KGN32952.1 hypothetical protein N802_16370 [Knoellia sinensis KCTC 19936]
MSTSANRHSEPTRHHRDDGLGRDGYDDGGRPDGDQHRERTDYAPGSAETGRRDLHAREQDAYGGMKFGSAFFGWLTAVGVAVILTALVAAAGTAVGVSTGTDPDTAVADAAADPATVGVVGAIILLVVLFVAYYCGGYVAGRMARFNGLKQGLAVWLWAVLAALVVAGVAAMAGSQYDVLSELNSFPRFPVDGGTLTTGGIIALIIAAVASLIGALLGGLAGMRFHRKVDRVGFAPEDARGTHGD